MSTSYRPLATAAVGAILSLGLVAPATAASAGQPTGDPCAKQEQQVAKAQDALARVTAVFEHQQTKVERLQARLAAAMTDAQRAKIQAQLDKALTHQHHDRKAKKAQQQRLAKAEARLDQCEAGQPA